MTPELDHLVSIVEESIRRAPDYDQADWDNSFAARAKFLREEIQDFKTFEGATYKGTVGDHTLKLGGIAVRGRDGYRQLLESWCSAARSAGEREVVPA
jgi:hypothetical protein